MIDSNEVPMVMPWLLPLASVLLATSHLSHTELDEVVPFFRARSGLRMNGQGDLQDERKEQEAGVECTTTVHR